MSEECCGKCRVWKEPVGPDDGSVTHPGKNSGACRRRAPVKMLIGSNPYTVFPVTDPNDWCGEFENIKNIQPMNEEEINEFTRIMRNRMNIVNK